MSLTVSGIDKRINGHFRPNRLATIPKTAKPIKPPNAFSEGIHEASFWKRIDHFQALHCIALCCYGTVTHSSV